MTTATIEDTRIKCEICGEKVHSIQMHLAKVGETDEKHSGITFAEYQRKFPGKPVLSAMAAKKIEEQEKSKAKKAEKAVRADFVTAERTKEPFHEVFALGASPATMGSAGKPIPITVLAESVTFDDMVPDLDPNYVFNVDVLKSLLMGIEARIPVYLWGHSGTGKTTMLEQICARTRRPMIRVQHTANMEEEHIVGGWRLRDGRTIFELGPLAMAMKHGWTYLADEYDFGRPEVTSVYQAVLEYKPLVIKEADAENRVIRPHPDFRIFGTGNTNGQGDESGLYQGTNLQNAANYERWGIVEQMPYMDKALEAKLVSQQARIPMEDAKKLVDFAGRIRAEYESDSLGHPISPRSLIFAALIGIARSNYAIGLEKAYINRLSSTDRETAKQVAQRVFG